MAKAAEQLFAKTGWLPTLLLRTPEQAWLAAVQTGAGEASQTQGD